MYAHESKINAKLHQTYINNMNYNNTHKMQCMIQNTYKMIGNSLHRTMFVHYFYTNDASLTGKIRIEKYN